MSDKILKYLNLVLFLVAFSVVFINRKYAFIVFILFTTLNISYLIKTKKVKYQNTKIFIFFMSIFSWNFFNIVLYKKLFTVQNLNIANFKVFNLYIIPSFFILFFLVNIYKKLEIDEYKFSILFDILSWVTILAVFSIPLIKVLLDKEIIGPLTYFILYIYILMDSVILSSVLVYIFKFRKLFENTKEYTMIMGCISIYIAINFISFIRIVFFIDLFIFEFLLSFIYIYMAVYIIEFYNNMNLIKIKDNKNTTFATVMETKHVIIPTIAIIFLFYFDYVSVFSLLLVSVVLFIDLNINIYVYSKRCKKVYSNRLYTLNRNLNENISEQTNKLLKVKSKLLNEVYKDPLTGLSSIEHYYIVFDEMLKISTSGVSICFINISNFRNINNYYSYDFGDKVLIAVANRLKSELPKDFKLFRAFSDEFIVMFDAIGLDEVKDVCNLIHNIFKESFNILSNSFFIRPNISVVRSPIDSKNPYELLQLAMISLYKGKESNSVENTIFYSSEFINDLNFKTKIESKLRESVIEKDYYVETSYRVSSNDTIDAICVKLKSNVAILNDLSTDEFIKAIKKTGLSTKLAVFYVEKFMNIYTSMLLQKNSVKKLCIYIDFNIDEFILIITSLDEIINKDFIEKISLEIYIDSFILQKVYDEYTYIFDIIKENNIKLVLKNFGVGFTSLHIINKCGVKGFILANELIENVDISKTEYSVVKSIIKIAEKFDAYVIATNIDRVTKFEILKKSGVTYCEGTYVMRSTTIKDKGCLEMLYEK
ncbi:MAG: hypothetical protein CSB15_00095 [Clostridiales bacterium]|nr:MAG: hypothetical protein CSB15_00095 [Clostridiales bacterium]